MVAGGIAGFINGFDITTVWLCLACGLLPAIAAVDLLFGIIPDSFNFLLAILGLAWLLTGGGELTVGMILGGTLLLLGLFGVLGLVIAGVGMIVRLPPLNATSPDWACSTSSSHP